MSMLTLKLRDIFFPSIVATVVLLSVLVSCKQNVRKETQFSFKEDSIKVQVLLKKGNSLYAQRSSMEKMGESLLYFDSGYNMAQRIGDTALLANTLFFIGNVYNAWNGEPLKTVDYYSRSASLFSKLHGEMNHVREFYLRYLIAHSYDGEKANDSIRCAQTILSAMNDLEIVPQRIKDSMNYLSDFAWVATNIKNYVLAEQIINNLSIRPKNDPESNNYLDHYYLSKARIDIYKYGRSTSYADSIIQALRNCNNRFDSGYYALNLSQFYVKTGDYKKAFYFSRLSTIVQDNVGKSDILTALRTQIINSRLEAEQEKEKRSREEIKIKDLYLYAAIVTLVLILMWVGLYNVYKKRKTVQLRIKEHELFTNKLLQKEEDERKRIAMELHDGINHELLTIKNNIILKKQILTGDVENIIRSVREMSRNLYPALFESIGLQGSVEALCSNMTEAGFFTTSDIDYDTVLDKDEELQLYRIIQEALNNVATHAQAEACKITIRSVGQNLFAEIKDNGRGFDSGAIQKKSFGLQSMKQRAKAFGADLTIESSKTGTIIKINKSLS